MRQVNTTTFTTEVKEFLSSLFHRKVSESNLFICLSGSACQPRHLVVNQIEMSNHQLGMLA